MTNLEYYNDRFCLEQNRFYIEHDLWPKWPLTRDLMKSHVNCQDRFCTYTGQILFQNWAIMWELHGARTGIIWQILSCLIPLIIGQIFWLVKLHWGVAVNMSVKIPGCEITKNNLVSFWKPTPKIWVSETISGFPNGSGESCGKPCLDFYRVSGWKPL